MTENNNININEALDAAEDTIEIDLVNTATGTTCSKAAVYSTNILHQVLTEYASVLGLRVDGKHQYRNKRTGSETVDENMTIKDFELREGDVLAISDDVPVAAIFDEASAKYVKSERG